MNVELISITPNAETQLVEIARVSSSRTDKSAEPAKLINYLIRNKHWSPFEHAFLTMKIVTSKAIAIQLLRHRSFTFQEFSQRYAKVTALEPLELRLQAEKNRQSSTDQVVQLSLSDKKVIACNDNYYELATRVDAYLREGQRLYNDMLEAGIARECARFILPMTTQSTLYMTGPIRSWIHMIRLRDDSHAQKEAQLIARKMKTIFKEACPIISAALEWREKEVTS